MIEEQKREGIGMAFTEGQRLEAVQIWQRASKLHRDGGDVTFNQLKAVLEAANHFEQAERLERLEGYIAYLRKAAKEYREEASVWCWCDISNHLDKVADNLERVLKGGGGE